MDWNDYPKDMEKLADGLRQREPTVDTANGLFTELGRYRSTWRKERCIRSWGSIPLPNPRKKGLHPRGCEIVKTELSFLFKAATNEDVLPRHADFQVRHAGELLLEEKIIELEDHWRIDTHVFAAYEAAGESEEANEPHPLFHFQRGGHAQDGFASHENFVPGSALENMRGKDFRALLQTPGPRIPCFPMCPILAIDFAISQCDGLIRRTLLDVPEYFEAVFRAQERLWKPIFEGYKNRELQKRLFGGSLLI